jgi:hypothetical protein
MTLDLPLPHPAISWEQDAQLLYRAPQAQLRLAAMAGHMRQDKVAARRAALIDLLADGRPHPREEIWQIITAQLGETCWGKRPSETLTRDLKALRQGGICISYSRHPGIIGYYLQYPAIRRPQPGQYEEINWILIENLRTLSVAEKNQIAFAAADFALRQKRLILAEDHPNWPADKIDREARKQVFGVSLVE